MMKILNSMITIYVLATLLSACKQTTTVSIEEANQLYFQMKPDKAYEMYEKIWFDSTFSKNDRAASARNLATMSWLLYDNADQAFKILKDLEAFDHEKSRCLTVWSRILTEEKNHNQAIQLAKQAITLAESTSQQYEAKLRFVNAVLEKYKNKVLAGNWVKEDMLAEDMNEAKNTIQLIMTESPGDVAASNLHLGISLLTRNYPQAYAGWLSFYRADPNGMVHSTLKPSQEKLVEGCISTDEFDEEMAKSIVNGLADSGFITYAVMTLKQFKNTFSMEESRFQDLWNYYLMLQKVGEHTVAFYRSEVRGDADKGAYENVVREEAELLWNQLSWESSIPEFDIMDFTAEMRKRFGTIARFMTANGHFGLSLGHVVLDEIREVEQYGKKGSLRYIAIDHMLSNGYSSWFWDGRAQIGGWAPDEQSILQVRSAYSGGPISAWLSVSDSVEITETLERIEKNTESDDIKAKDDPYTYLPGMTARINYNARMDVLNELKSQGLEGRELRTAFINTMERLALESSIFAHEGRHAIDKKYSGRLRSEELEYRAKLSEIYFAERPFLALNAVLGANNGDGTSHGDANRRVVKGIVKWMDDHKDEISNLDDTRPLLPQLDKLSDDQLKQAINSLDPLAK